MKNKTYNEAVNECFLKLVAHLRRTMSAAEVANSIGISRQGLNLILLNKRNVSFELLERACKAHNVPLAVSASVSIQIESQP